MKTTQPIVINGQRIGKLRASIVLFKETWRFLQADKELLLLPLLSLLLNVFLFGILVAIFAIGSGVSNLLPSEDQALTLTQWGFIFGCYLIGAFSLALGQAAISFTVFTRAHGGDATLNLSLKTAFSHWRPLFVWSIISSTVGIILNAISERSQLLGKVVVMLVGTAWSVLTYFVVPAMVLDKHNAFAAISKSGQVFKKTWGETFVSNISLSLAFLVIHAVVLLSVVGILIAASIANVPVLILGVIGVYVVWLMVMILVSSTMSGILKTLLYIYASEANHPTNFNEELLSQMLVRTSGVSPAVAEPISVT